MVVTAALLSHAPELWAQPLTTGPYTEVGIGATNYLGDAANAAKMGPAFELRAGHDLFSWLSVGVALGSSTHEATVPPPPQGEYYQRYSVAVEARLAVPIGRVSLFADGGAGLTFLSSNILQKVGILAPGQQQTTALSAGGGLAYHLQNRHYALGVASQWTNLLAFSGTQSVTGRAYLRYTY